MSVVSSDAPNQLEEIVIKLKEMILVELSGIELTNHSDTKTSVTAEQKLKTYTGFFKLVQCLEEMTQRINQERDKKSDRGMDILEFRKQLEKQIAKLVDEKVEISIS